MKIGMETMSKFRLFALVGVVALGLSSFAVAQDEGLLRLSGTVLSQEGQELEVPILASGSIVTDGTTLWSHASPSSGGIAVMQDQDEAKVKVIKIPHEGKIIEITVRGDVLGVKVGETAVALPKPEKMSGEWRFSTKQDGFLLSVTPKLTRLPAGAFLGVVVEPVGKTLRRQMTLGDAGLVITAITADSAAAAAELQADDVILSISGDRVATLSDLQTSIKKKKPGQEIRVKLLRDGNHITKDISLGHRIIRSGVPVKGSVRWTDADGRVLGKAQDVRLKFDPSDKRGQALPIVKNLDPGSYALLWDKADGTKALGRYSVIKGDADQKFLLLDRKDSKPSWVSGATGLWSVDMTEKKSQSKKSKIESRLARIEKKLERILKRLDR